MEGESTLAQVSVNPEPHFSPPATAHDSIPANEKSGNVLERVWKAILSKESLFIALIFLLGFIVRAHLMRFELFFEFDSYWHARMVSYLLQGMPAPVVDPLAYYHNVAAATIGNPPLFFWYVSATLYKIFTLNGAYDFETWVLFVKILPAFYGALTCVAMYFLGKELFKGQHEKAAGLFAGVLAALVPSFVYRTMGGFFEDDSFGFLWMVIGFVFFVRAVRNPSLSRENILNAVLAGLGFALMALAWSGFNMLVPILLGVGFFQFLVWLQEGNTKEARNYGVLWLISFGLMAIGATIQTKLFWLDQFGGILGNLFLGSSEIIKGLHVLGAILVFIVLLYALLHLRTRNIISQKVIQKVFMGLVLLLVLAPLVVSIFNVSLQSGDVLGQTVGEESEGRNYFGNKYSMLVLFAVIGIPAMGYLLIRKSRHYEFLVIPLVWVVVVFFMAWGKLKFTYYWGIPLALTGMVVLVLGLKWMQHRSIATQKVAALGMGFMMLCAMGAGIFFVTQNVPNIEMSPGWKTALFWSNQNLPADAKFFNWWDEGHWISFLTNRKVLIDNRNADTKATADVAKFLLSTDANEAKLLVDKYQSTRLIFGDDLLEKLPNLGFYAYNITNANDPRIQGMFGSILSCSRNEVALTKEVTYSCEGNTFTPAEMESYPTIWQATPNNLQDGTPFFIYREPDNRTLYAFTTPANQTMMVRLWLQDPDLWDHFGEVYRNTQGVRIYAVK